MQEEEKEEKKEEQEKEGGWGGGRRIWLASSQRDVLKSLKNCCILKHFYIEQRQQKTIKNLKTLGAVRAV